MKLTIIGAGSAAFSMSIVHSIVRTPSLKGSTICFMDVNADRLETVHLLCKRYLDEVGLRMALHATTDRRQALEGADFVMTTALAADHGRLREGWEIARRHGYRFGGSLHIMHDEAFWINFYQLRLMESVTRDIRLLCPRAWHVLVANPVQAGTTFLCRRHPDVRTVGMCHGYAGVYSVANRLGLNPDDISFEIPGVNHFIWLTKLLCNGEDVLHRLREWVSERSAEHFKTCGMSAHEGPKPVDLYRRYGAFPIGDTANPGGGAWGWWYHVDDATERRWQEDPYQWYLRHFEGGLAAVASMSRTAHDPAASVRALFPEVVSRDPMIPLIEALSGRAERVVIVNTLNGGGYVPGVPADYEVEVPALCTRNGVHPMRTDGLPQALLAHLLSDRVAPVETELAAYEQGSRKLLLDLMLQDPFTRSLDQAEKFLDAILALPYHSEMREHYR